MTARIIRWRARRGFRLRRLLQTTPTTIVLTDDLSMRPGATMTFSRDVPLRFRLHGLMIPTWQCADLVVVQIAVGNVHLVPGAELPALLFSEVAMAPALVQAAPASNVSVALRCVGSASIVPHVYLRGTLVPRWSTCGFPSLLPGRWFWCQRCGRARRDVS